MKLNINQKRAVEYLDGPLLVLAGPGTGKTQLLSEKVAYILNNTDTNPENILCLTFTESGAFNMRERLKSTIGRDGAKVNISTYHAFGQEILSQYKNYNPDYDRRLDASLDEIAQYKIIKQIQDNLDGNDILRGDKIKDIISVISEAKQAGLCAEQLAVIAKQNMDDSSVLSNSISPLLQNVVPRVFKESYENAYLPIYQLLKNYETTKPITGKIERNISIISRDLKEAISLAEATKKIKPLSNWKDTYFEKDEKGNYRLKDLISNRKLLSLSSVMSKYENVLKENGWYDFDDMIEEAAFTLRNDEGFRLTLEERYQFIMLDEFQDTNPSQFAIVKELTNYEKPLIMAVGDDDQAIYEFQGALSSNLTDFKDYYQAEVIPLTDNYRSTQEILDFSRNIINQASDRFADKKLISHRPSPKSSQIFRFEFNSSEEEFGFIADEISRLVQKGVKQNEIAVISYKSKYFEPLLPFLKSHPEIKIAYEKRDNLFEEPRIHELLTLSKYIHELANGQKPTVNLMEILSYPFFELPTIEIVKLVNQARAAHADLFDYLSEHGSDKVQTVMQFLADLTAHALSDPLELMLDYMIGASSINGYNSPFLKYYTESEISDKNQREYETFLLYENLASLRGKLNKHFGDKALKLADLVEMINDYELAEMPLNSSSPYRDADEAVQILTAHKAKGLEFEYVFIISTDHTAWGSGKGNNNFLTLPKNLTQIRHTGMTDSERLRVLYVALTRAKHTLYLTNSVQDFNGKSPERLEYLDEKVEKTESGEEVIVSPFIPSERVVKMSIEKSFAARKNNLENWLKQYLVASPDMRAFYKSRMEGFKMSASALTSFIDIIYSGPEAFFKSYILNAPSEPSNWSIVFGNLVHATFEAVTKQNLSDDEALKFYIDGVSKADLTDGDKKVLLDKGRDSIEASLTAFGEIIHHGQAEIDFYSESLIVDGVPVTGKIDHLLINEADKTIEVYDYKTGSYHNNNWKSHPAMYQYMLQLIFYKVLLNNSIRYRNYRVTKGHILFVSKDKNDGEVHEREYVFNADDENDFKKILFAVYRQATSLQFLDDEELFISPDKGRNMKDIRSFIELMLAKTDNI